MQIGIHGMPFVWATPGAHVFTFDSKDLKDMEKNLKDLKVRPFDGESRHILIAPKPPTAAAPEPKAAPAAPKAAPAPAPKTPEPPQ